MNASRRLLAAGLAALAAVGFALFTQHAWDMQPCPWCVLQRLLFTLVGLLCVAGALLPAAGRRAAAALAFVLSGCGIAAALWQHFVAAKSASCNLTLADRIVSGIGLDAWLPEVFAPRASCADAIAKLAGIDYELWSLALFALLAVAALRGLRRG